MFAKRRSEDNILTNSPDAKAAKHLTHTKQWRCMNCGQYVFVVVGSEPPDTCQYCNDMTTWQLAEH